MDIDWTRFAKKRIGFFVDRDLSSFLGGEKHSGENLYVTDKYSIDSEIVTSRTFQRTLEEVYGVTDLTPTESEAVQILFDSNLIRFCEAMCPVMAQIILWRRAGAEVCLDNIESKEFFTFSNAKINLKPQYTSPTSRIHYAAVAVNVPPSTPSDISTAEAEFRVKNGPEQFTRGKYLLWFFAQMAKEFHQAAPAFCAKHKVPPKASVNIGITNAMAVVGPRARWPMSFKKFIEVNFLNYIQSVQSGSR